MAGRVKLYRRAALEAAWFVAGSAVETVFSTAFSFHRWINRSQHGHDQPFKCSRPDGCVTGEA